MPLSAAKPGLKSAIESAFKAQLESAKGADTNKDVSAEDLITKLADALTNAIHDYVTQATVNVNPGISVSTAGSPAAQTGATTSPGTGNLS
ncbi:hypothetical protein [Limnobacter sp.]|uniref:hypothetical protein n=1 Tax=Limnobacter sp. TaxID=2003368 RepID=UPI00311FDB79